MSTKGRARRVLLACSIAGLTLIPIGPAAAHVHGITPLRCVGNGPDGAGRTDTTPAAEENGGPIDGLIPKDVGSSALDVEGGGFDTPACPA